MLHDFGLCTVPITGVTLGSDDPPQRQRNFFEAILVWEGAEFGENNRLGDMKGRLRIVETGLEELSLKRICDSSV